jgi:hypothetical protein
LSGSISRTSRAGVPARLERREDAADIVQEGGAPRTADEAVTLLLSMVAREAPSYGTKTAHYTQAQWASRVYLYPHDAGVRFIREVAGRGWLKEYRQSPTDTNAMSLELTLAGWDEHQRRARRGMESETVFVASWGDPILEEATAAIVSAIQNAGLKAVVGVRLASQSRVTEDIEAEIRHARLLIAEFTGARAGVYWEAGFARGLGLPVIYCCHDQESAWSLDHPGRGTPPMPTPVARPWKDLLHFDTRQFPHIPWRTPEELRQRVLSKIRGEGWDVRSKAAPR